MIEIRPARAEDVPALLPMVRKICELHEAWDPRRYGALPDVERRYDGWLRSLANDRRAVFLVAESDAGQMVGFVIGTVERAIPIYRLAEFGFVHDLWVEPEYRHEGVGRQLTMMAVERFGAVGMRQVRLETAVANEPARRLFEQCGFRPSAVELLMEIAAEPRAATDAPDRR